MIKNIKKIAMLFFVAATMITATSCGKDIEEDQVLGTWKFPSELGYSDLAGGKMEVKSDHTVKFYANSGSISFDWTLDNNHLICTLNRGSVNAQMDMEIKEITSSSMTIEGDYIVMGDNKGSVDGTLTKIE